MYCYNDITNFKQTSTFSKGPFSKHYWGVEAFQFSLTKSEDCQNLGATLLELAESWHPPPRIGKIWVSPPPKYMYINILINAPICVLWHDLSYFSFFDNYYLTKSGLHSPSKDWQNIAPPPQRIGRIWAPPSDEWRNLGTPPPQKSYTTH